MALLCVLVLPFFLSKQVHSDQTQEYASIPMAPENHWIGQLELMYSRFDSFLDNNRDKVDLLSAYEGLDFNAALLPSLSSFGSNATLGKLSLAGSFNVKRLEFTLGYGITENLTVGAILPYADVCSTIKLDVKKGNIGINPAFNSNQTISAKNVPFIPITQGGLQLNADRLNAIITQPNYHYKAIKSTCKSFFGDPVIGALWRVVNTHNDVLIATMAGRIGIVEKDDPDDIFDIPLDNGNDNAIVQLEYFHLFPFGFNTRLLFRYTLQITDDIEIRLADASHSLLTAASQKQQVKRNLGNIFEYEVELGKRIGNWRLSGALYFWRKEIDSYQYKGEHILALENSTGTKINQWRTQLMWSGIKAWRQGNIPVPLIVQLEYQNTFAGKNVLLTEDIYLTFQIAF